MADDRAAAVAEEEQRDAGSLLANNVGERSNRCDRGGNTPGPKSDRISDSHPPTARDLSHRDHGAHRPHLEAFLHKSGDEPVITKGVLSQTVSELNDGPRFTPWGPAVVVNGDPVGVDKDFVYALRCGHAVILLRGSKQVEGHRPMHRFGITRVVDTREDISLKPRELMRRAVRPTAHNP